MERGLSRTRQVAAAGVPEDPWTVEAPLRAGTEPPAAHDSRAGPRAPSPTPPRPLPSPASPRSGSPGTSGAKEVRGQDTGPSAWTSVPETRLRSVVEGSLEVVILADARERIEFFSPGASDALGWSVEDASGRTVTELVHPDDAGRLSPAAPDGAPHRFTARFLHRDGTWRVLQGLRRDLLADPSVRAVVTNARDVTEQHQLQEQLRRAQRLEAIGALAGGVAHDFNNLLAVINGYAEAALRDIDESDPLCADLREMLEAGRRGAVLTRQLLAFTRRQIAQPSPVMPSTVVRELEKMLRRVLGEHITLEVRLAPDCGKVLADPAQLEQVVMNLAVNAREAISGPGVLTIECRNGDVDAARAARHPGARPGPHLVLSVSDTGRAMDPAALAHLDESSSPSRSWDQVTGLGLSMVRDIVRECGGLVEVETEVGRGTRFSVYLPRTSGEEEAVSGDGAPACTAGRGTVLVVEDDERLRAVAVQTLDRAGYEVLDAATGEQALEIAGRHRGRIDLLVTDVVMPRMPGTEVARRLAELRPEANVLFTSGYVGAPASLRDALVSRANFLAKPYTAGALVRKAWEVVAAGGARAAGGRLAAAPAPPVSSVASDGMRDHAPAR